MGILHPNRILPPTQLAAHAHTGGRGGGAANADSRDGGESQIGRNDIGNKLILLLWSGDWMVDGEGEGGASMLPRHVEAAVKHENMKIC